MEGEGRDEREKREKEGGGRENEGELRPHQKPVILITNDRGCLRMAKEHNLPATSLSDLDRGLAEHAEEPWTAEVIRKV
jgi:hypothetical protein